MLPLGFFRWGKRAFTFCSADTVAGTGLRIVNVSFTAEAMRMK
ncbi:hypothetical protein F441_21398 [Phytophthora nicotianae CJ01A1]|uniref:Uncharacterized protein n=4 Tax=Phytophthora nicotianae TaxID=4792 RepID=V9DYZ6_PHYNI|nr:hypothetical protein F443_21516 [Phytophthora nicotianae P1569]ETK71916.1 hypothetical protein L915_20911 [Phytophthora nicotianae]ETO60243.1 hypothetical protein F444_21527 [Phytophthora nicotianae P1976]ETP01344.1 hypothetical protein F441_21398 [Phytophthora nicotianae CJ01A1]ETL25347.1 hypothetical protein L916_20794 [Phytophthora nicotianae]